MSRRRKWQEYETVFKATTLGAVVVGGIAMAGGLNRRKLELRIEVMDVDVRGNLHQTT